MLLLAPWLSLILRALHASVPLLEGCSMPGGPPLCVPIARSRTCSRTSLKIRIAICLLMAMLEGSASSWASSSRAPSSVWAPLWAPTGGSSRVEDLHDEVEEGPLKPVGSSRDDNFAMDLASTSMAEIVISPISEHESEDRAGGAHDGAPTRHRIRQPPLCRCTLRRAMTPAIRANEKPNVPNTALCMTGTAGPEGGDGGDGGGNEEGGDGGGRGGSGG